MYDSPIKSSSGPGESKRHVSFIIALWLEPREQQGEPNWRWRVTEVNTGEKVYFHRIDDLLAYVSEKSGVSPPR